MKKMFIVVGPCQIFNKGCERNSQKHRRGGQLLRTVRYTIFIISPCMSLQSLWAHQHAVLVDSDYFDLAWAPRAVNMFLRTFPFWQSIILLKKRPGERKKTVKLSHYPRTETDPLATQGSANQAVQDQEEKALNWFDLNLAHQVAKILLELHSSRNLRTCYRAKILTKISTAPSTGILSFKFHVELVSWKIAGLVGKFARKIISNERAGWGGGRGRGFNFRQIFGVEL